MRLKKQFLSLLAVAAFTSSPFLVHAQAKDAYVYDTTIALPGDGGYDYLSIDQPNQQLYVSHGTAVNVIDLNTGKLRGTIDGMKGVHGIALVNSINRGFITDGRANAVVEFDVTTLKIISVIPVTAKGPDAIIYDAFSNRVFSLNGESNNSSVVDPDNLKQIGTVDLGGGPEYAVSNGKGLIYNNLEDKNSLNVIDSKTMKVVKNFPLAPCGGPTGIAFDAETNRLFTVCRQNKGMSVVDALTGKVITTLPIGTGVDAVAFDAETKLIFCSNGDGTTTIFHQNSADSYSLIQTLKTQFRAKTLALDTKTHKIYLSVADIAAGTKKMIPGTFKVLVYKMN